MRDEEKAGLRRSLIESWLRDGTTKNLDLTINDLQLVRAAFLEEFAARLETPVRSHFAIQPDQDVRQKTKNAHWLNVTLEKLGLCIKCQETGLGGTMIVDQRANRYRIKAFYTNQARSFSSTVSDLSSLQFTQRPSWYRHNTPFQSKLGVDGRNCRDNADKSR